MFTKEQAEIVAIQALGYLAGAPEELEKFISVTAMDSNDLTKCAHSADGLAGILDYVCQDESILLGFCSEYDIRPDDPMRALHALQKQPDTGAA